MNHPTVNPIILLACIYTTCQGKSSKLTNRDICSHYLFGQRVRSFELASILLKYNLRKTRAKRKTKKYGQSNTLVFKVDSLLVKFYLFITLYIHRICIHPNIVWFAIEPFLEERSYESLQMFYSSAISSVD